MQAVTTRDYYFDNLKFLLIALVVVGHALEPLNPVNAASKSLYHLIYFFHIPLFIFVTGYFSKKLDKISPFLILYVVFETLYTLLDGYLNHRTSIRFSYFSPFWVTWYLLAVILWKIALPYFLRLKYPVLIAGILAVLAGYASKDLGYNLSAMRAITFFPFFLTGYFVKREHLHFLFKRPVKMVSLLILLCSLYLCYRYVGQLKTEWLWGSYSYKYLGETEWFAGLYRIAVSAATVILSLAVLSLVPERKTWFSELGTKTMYPFLLHGFLIKYLIHNGFFAYVDTGFEVVMLIAAAVALSVLLSLRWVDKSLLWLFRPRLAFLFREKPG
jgi:fucose 4-O-acetylase-like acetyltransferase